MLQINDGVVVTDPNLPDNLIFYVNPAFERITGYSVDEPSARAAGSCRGPRTRISPP